MFYKYAFFSSLLGRMLASAIQINGALSAQPSGLFQPTHTKKIKKIHGKHFFSARVEDIRS
jgi:hypothetical protein